MGEPMTGMYGASAGALPSALPPDWLQHPEKLVGVVLGGRYRITGLLGRGPMGVACEGESSRGRQVTLKLLPRPTELPAERFAWQVREALAMAHFDHENVIPGTDFGALEGGGAFVSRNRFAGVPLRSLLMRQGSLPLRRALELGRQVALGLGAGHAQDIPHGRLKPENVLIQVASQSKPDLIKIVDFGMAQLPVDVRSVVSNEHEARRLALRTRVYLPRAHLPGAEGLPSSPAVDVYSLGVLLFEMIAGQPPFVMESGLPNLQGGTIDFARCNPPLQVPRSVEEVVLGLLVPNVGVTAQQVVAVLDSLLGRASVAPPPAAPELERVTAQRQSAQLVTAQPSAAVPGPEPAPATIKGVAPELRNPSWPPLPAGISVSQPPTGSLPPGAPAAELFPGVAAAGKQPGTLPPGRLPPGTLPPGTFPPGTLPSAGQRPATVPPGQHFSAVPSFPPAPLLPTQSLEATMRSVLPSPLPPAQSPSATSYPPLTLDGSLAPAQPSLSSPSADLDTDEAEFRPSLLARIRRMFGRSKPSGEL